MTELSLDSLAHPLVLAPMAGGPSTPALAAAVSAAGGLGFLAAGYRSVADVRADIAELRGFLPRGIAFGLNIFAPPGRGAGSAEVSEYADALGAEAQRHGVVLGEPRWDDDHYADKVELAVAERVPVVSFTFGCPSAELVSRLRAAGVAVWVTVTTVPEAQTAMEAGAAALVVQGVEAGGHRGSFDDAHPGEIGLLALLQLVRAALGESVPLVATGGISTGAGVAAALAAGAAAAQLGSAFMLCPEAGTPPAQRERMAAGVAETALTRAFTGRLARGIANRFLVEHTREAPSAYPQLHHLTAPLRAAARAEQDADGFNLWAGQAYSLARPIPAAELVAQLSREARAAFETAGRRARP